MASSRQAISLVLMVVLVVAANFLHSAVGIREMNNPAGGVSDGSTDHSLKKQPYFDIIMHQFPRLFCSPQGVTCNTNAPFLCCSGVCIAATVPFGICA
ncbi:hypothetical protein Tsubulata_043773 [Turnera subulata]|uniref:DUF5637 domain-containing protein n=1 Tax=Turnera subulata TaxID=218843 RepID=A0A9Q0FVD0_9ROSI|nr:hypothetical protein Tsubulata_043773 [Turnera subulata]